MKRELLFNQGITPYGGYVLYWMQASQRAMHNPALEFAVKKANQLKLPLIVFFGLTENYPEANVRHYHFMLKGLEETASTLINSGVGFILEICEPLSGALKYAKESAYIVMDAGWLKFQKNWRREIIKTCSKPCAVVDSNTIYPILEISDKEEYSAATLRRKIQKYPVDFSGLPDFITPDISSEVCSIPVANLNLLSSICGNLNIDKTVSVTDKIIPGTNAAIRQLSKFIDSSLDTYHIDRNDPVKDTNSWMSPYLHFGQISPMYIADKIKTANLGGSESYLEELIVRRELAFNFVNYNPEYDNIKCLHSWALNSLDEHKDDIREYIYTPEEFEDAKTHDMYWNAAMTEMKKTGYMHGYMRMYWGKKVLEWSPCHTEAYNTLVYLNNKYFLDGRDPNGYAGIAWCFGKHDRAWQTREVFGKIRYMNANGLKRKFDADLYAYKWL